MAVTPQTNTTLKDIAKSLDEHDDFVICGHVSPDGDCIGSQLALMHALRAMGKRADCVLVRDEPLGAALSFMPGADEMVPACAYAGNPRVFIGVDVPTRERVEEPACALRDRCGLSITVDHHAYDTTMCDLVYVDPDAASASMLVWEIAKLLLKEPPLECAICAYTGLVTDTGGFRYQNADARAFATASELVEHGADPSSVAMHVFQSRTVASLELERLVIERKSLTCDGRVAISWITNSDLDEHAAMKSDTEPLVDLLRSIHGVRVACMLREQDGVVRGSLRSKDDTDVSVLAREFGGGGHKAAAGFTLYKEIGEAVALLERKIAELVS